MVCFTLFLSIFPGRYMQIFPCYFCFSFWNRCEKHKSKCFERSIYYLRSFKINSQVETMKSSVWCGPAGVYAWTKDGAMRMASDKSGKKERRKKQTNHWRTLRQPMRPKWIKYTSNYSPSCVLLNVIYSCVNVIQCIMWCSPPCAARIILNKQHKLKYLRLMLFFVICFVLFYVLSFVYNP